MNISYNWLKHYIPVTMTPADLADALTSIGLETGGVDEVESIRGGLRGLVIGKVLTCEAHPDSDHLHVTTVDLGDGTATQIVCGAPNVAAGQTVVVATVGTTLYDGDKEFKIKKSKIRGVESLGMICAEDEIGVGTSHDGIIVIDRDVAPGTPAAEYFGLTSDYVLEVDLTPNRIDAASHYGVARDLSAWSCQHGAAPLKASLPVVDGFKADRADGAATVEVADTEACPRYSGLTIRGVKVGESPKWLRDLLTAIGQRPINSVVDITNYILLGLGQPLHCFDLKKVDGEKITVRHCQEGTPFVTLDGVEHKLSDRDLMICSATKPMCIAGVFGGLDSGVTEETTDIFLESAYFNPTSIRKTARRQGLQTDASFRYERGTDPNFTLYALKVAALMIKEIAGGEICGEPVDIYPTPVEPAEVTLDYDYARRLIGKELPEATIDSIAEALEMGIKSHGDGAVTLTVPTYRVDVTRPCDVVEDVLRIYGYNNVEISDEVHSSLQYKTPTDMACDLRTLISEQLTAVGFNEILNNSLTAEAYYADNAKYPAEGCVRLLNPLSNELSVMRRTLLYGGLETVAHNINRRIDDLALYEFGNVYHCNPQAEPTAERPLSPYTEQSHLALWITGAIRPGNWARSEEKSTVYDLRAAVANIFDRMGISRNQITYAPTSDSMFVASLSIATRSGKRLGELGVLSNKELKPFGIKQPVYYAELDWEALASLAMKQKVSYTALPKTHPVRRDLALLVDDAVAMQQIEAVVNRSERHLITGIELFDVYEGENLPQGKKSYAIALTLQDIEKTLQDKQIDAVMNKVIANLKKELGAELR